MAAQGPSWSRGGLLGWELPKLVGGSFRRLQPLLTGSLWHSHAPTCRRHGGGLRAIGKGCLAGVGCQMWRDRAQFSPVPLPCA
eukprot:6371420-Pyramimonas_sp.AAC.1